MGLSKRWVHSHVPIILYSVWFYPKKIGFWMFLDIVLEMISFLNMIWSLWISWVGSVVSWVLWVRSLCIRFGCISKVNVRKEMELNDFKWENEIKICQASLRGRQALRASSALEVLGSVLTVYPNGTSIKKDYNMPWTRPNRHFSPNLCSPVRLRLSNVF